MKIFYRMKRDIDDKKTGDSAQADRVKAGVSQVELATQLGVHPAYLSGLECGQRGWSIKWVARYKEALHAIKTK